MPHSDLHKKKRKKNLMILLMVLGWCALIWAVSMVRIANAAETDISKAFIKQRVDLRNRSQIRTEAWGEIYDSFADDRAELERVRNHNRNVHMQYNQKAEEVWQKKWEVMTPLKNIFQTVDDRRRENHLRTMEAREQEWWNDWQAENTKN